VVVTTGVPWLVCGYVSVTRLDRAVRDGVARWGGQGRRRRPGQASTMVLSSDETSWNRDVMFGYLACLGSDWTETDRFVQWENVVIRGRDWTVY
jgi:hypothetical protein